MTNRLSRIIDDDDFNRGIQIESAGDPEARNTKSSAAGLGQFIIGTWNAVGQKHYPAEKRAAGERWAGMRVGRDTAALQLRMMARFWEDNARIIGSTRGGDLYLAHFLGAGGAMKLTRADPSASAPVVAGDGPAQANPTVFYAPDGRARTCAEVRAWAEASMRTKWEKGGRKDFVGMFYGGDKAPPVDSPKSDKTTATVGGAVIVGGAGAGAAAAAGYDWVTIGVFGACVAVVAVAVLMIIRSARRS